MKAAAPCLGSGSVVADMAIRMLCKEWKMFRAGNERNGASCDLELRDIDSPARVQLKGRETWESFGGVL